MLGLELVVVLGIAVLAGSCDLSRFGRRIGGGARWYRPRGWNLLDAWSDADECGSEFGVVAGELGPFGWRGGAGPGDG